MADMSEQARKDILRAANETNGEHVHAIAEAVAAYVGKLEAERDELAASIAFMTLGKVPTAWANCPGCPRLDEHQCAAETVLDENRALEARLADLQGVSDVNERLAGELHRERHRADALLDQRDQAIDHVRRLNARAELAEARLAALGKAADWRAGHVRITCHKFYKIETVPELADALRACDLGVCVVELPERVAGEKSEVPCD